MSAHACHNGSVGFLALHLRVGKGSQIGLVYAKVTSPRLPFFSKIIFCQTIEFVLRNMKKRSEDTPENLGGLGGMLPADVLKKINQLLEQLHQADFTNHGSKIEVVYVASGGQHVETQYISLTPNPSPKGEGNFKGREKAKERPALPDVLCTEEAMALWEKVQKAGYVDDNFQPLISRTQSALLADAMAERLGIREKWKVFEALWNRKNMYKDFYRAMEQKQSLIFQDKLKQIFA